MDNNLSQIFRNCQLYDSVSEAQIQDVQNYLGQNLPPEYQRLLQFSNGLEGCIDDQNKIYIEIWPAEKLNEANDYYQTQDSIPGIILIGSFGKDEAIALDMR